MTTFQDPPPHSRRAARANERAETPAEGVAPATQPESAPYSFDTSAQQPPAAAPSTSGRRAEHRGAQPAEGESAEQASYRVRDYSPEGRRSAGAASSGSSAARPVELDYQTQGVPPARSHAATPAPPLEDTMNHTLSRRELREMRAAAEAQAPALQLPPDSIPEPIDSLLNSGPIAIPTLAPPPGQSQALADAMAEFDLLTRSRREAEARARDAQVASLATPIVPQPVTPLPQSVPQPPAAELPQSVPQPPVEQVAPVQQLPFGEPSTPEPHAYQQPSAAQPSAPAATPAPTPLPELYAQPSVPSVEQPPALAAPVFSDPPSAVLPPSQPVATPSTDTGRSPRAAGHWRVQAEAEDDELPYENTISRTVGANPSAITTSALVLPSVPQPDSLLNAITSTGEILVTGTIDLPRSLGSTGAHPNRIDNSDFEDDPLDSQVSAPDSAPIRAIRAVSTNTSTRGVIETKKPTGSRMLTAVIVVASVLCVSLVGLLVYAFATNKL